MERPISQAWAKYLCVPSDALLWPSDEANITLADKGEHWALKGTELGYMSYNAGVLNQGIVTPR